MADAPGTTAAPPRVEDSGLVVYAPQTYESDSQAEQRLRKLGASERFLALRPSRGLLATVIARLVGLR